jgi:hypothetical protein
MGLRFTGWVKGQAAHSHSEEGRQHTVIPRNEESGLLAWVVGGAGKGKADSRKAEPSLRSG